MVQILNPIFERKEEDLLKSTQNRFFSLFKPIQAVNNGIFTKESDFLGYIANPLIDTFILEPLFAVDASIHILNAILSFAKAAYLWSLNQQNSTEEMTTEAKQEFNLAIEYILHSVSMLIAETCNSIFSLISLITRPFASIIQVGVNALESYSSPGLTSSH